MKQREDAVWLAVGQTRKPRAVDRAVNAALVSRFDFTSLSASARFAQSVRRSFCVRRAFRRMLRDTPRLNCPDHQSDMCSDALMLRAVDQASQTTRVLQHGIIRVVVWQHAAELRHGLLGRRELLRLRLTGMEQPEKS